MSTTAQGASQAFPIESRINIARNREMHPSARRTARRRRAIFGDVVICFAIATLCNPGTWSLPSTITALVMPNKCLFESFVGLSGSRKSDRDSYVLERLEIGNTPVPIDSPDIRRAFKRLENRSIVIEQYLYCLGLLETSQNAHGADLDVVH